MELAVRHFAATTIGFIPSEHVATVRLNGSPLTYVMNLGYNPYSPRGEEVVNFHYALFYFCLDLCSQGQGDRRYNPNPLGGAYLPQANAGGVQGVNANHVPPAPNHEFGLNDLEELFEDLPQQQQPAPPQQQGHQPQPQLWDMSLHL
jgi:hypothetical protein